MYVDVRTVVKSVTRKNLPFSSSSSSSSSSVKADISFFTPFLFLLVTISSFLSARARKRLKAKVGLFASIIFNASIVAGHFTPSQLVSLR